MRHARKPDTRPADEPSRNADERDQPPVTRAGRRAARSASVPPPPVALPPVAPPPVAPPPVAPPPVALPPVSRPPVAPPPVAPPRGYENQPAGEHTVFYPVSALRDYKPEADSEPASEHTVFYPVSALRGHEQNSEPVGEHTALSPALPSRRQLRQRTAGRPQFTPPPVMRHAPPGAPTYTPPSAPSYAPPGAPAHAAPAPAHGAPASAPLLGVPASSAPPSAPAHARSVPGQPRFPPASPPNGYNRPPAPASDPFPAGPGPFPAGPAPFPVAAPSGPAGHGRAKPKTKTKTKGRRPPRRIRNRRAVIAVAVIAALVSVNVGLMMLRSDPTSKPGPTLAAVPQPSPTASASTVASNKNYSTRLGVFKATPAEVVEFENWLGRKVKDVVHFSSRDTWGQVTDPNLTAWKGTPYRLIYAVPMLPNNEEPTKETSMRAGARGEYDKHFVTLARNLVAAGQEDAVLRVGWEFNLDDWAWGIKDHEVFKRFFRHVVTAMRSVPGENFKIDWNLNNAWTTYDAVKYYPGSKYVDYIGIDAYDLDSEVYPYPKNCDDGCRLEMQTEAWDEVIFGAPRGLDFWAQFAADRKKPLSFPEYGLWNIPDGSGGGDNPFFIEQMHDFITWAPNNVAYAAYFDVDGADGEHTLRKAFPVSGKHFLKLFGAKKKK